MSSQPPTYSPPRVLFLDCAPFCGGAQESLLSLLTALRSQDQPMLLLTADSCPNGLGERAQAAGINTTAITTRHWRKSLSGLWQFWVDHRVAAPLLQQAATDFQPDLVHCNGIRAALPLAMPEASRRLPVVIHDRDTPPLRRQAGWREAVPHVVAISPRPSGRLWQLPATAPDSRGF